MSKETVLETEAKYLLESNGHLESVVKKRILTLARDIGLVAKRPTLHQETDCYYDDTNLSLGKKGGALRMRVDRDLKPVLTLKIEPRRDGGTHVRRELEGSPDSETIRAVVETLQKLGLDWNGERPSQIHDWKRLVSALHLVPILVLVQIRRKRDLVGRAKTDAKFSVDRVRYIWPMSSFTPTIFEIECFSEDARHLVDRIEKSIHDGSLATLKQALLSKLDMGIALQRRNRDDACD